MIEAVHCSLRGFFLRDRSRSDERQQGNARTAREVICVVVWVCCAKTDATDARKSESDHKQIIPKLDLENTHETNEMCTDECLNVAISVAAGGCSG